VSGENPWLARTEITVALLTLGAGAMDALSFVALGEVFTSAMTGNTVLLGVAIGEGRILASARAVAALVGFIAGAAIASRPLVATERGAFSRGVARGFAIEACFLALFAALFIAVGRGAPEAVAIVMILLASSGMGAQSLIAHHLGVPGITTTVFTGTLTTIVYGLTGVAADKAPPAHMPHRTARQIAAFAVYATGAALGGFLAHEGLRIVGAVPLAAVLAVLGSFAVRGADPA
jgi:uncharacterized membrane protein YoaK (UPF0700 family)